MSSPAPGVPLCILQKLAPILSKHTGTSKVFRLFCKTLALTSFKEQDWTSLDYLELAKCKFSCCKATKWQLISLHFLAKRLTWQFYLNTRHTALHSKELPMGFGILHNYYVLRNNDKYFVVWEDPVGNRQFFFITPQKPLVSQFSHYSYS